MFAGIAHPCVSPQVPVLTGVTDALREALVHELPRVAVPFPPKRWLHVLALCDMAPGGRHDPAVVAERANAFHAWATELLAMPGARELPAVREFFGLEGEAPSFWRPWTQPFQPRA